MVSLEKALKMMSQWLFTDKIVAAKKNGSRGREIELNSDIGEKVALCLIETSKEPRVFVNRQGEITFNDTAKKYANENDVKDAIYLLIGFEYLTPPTLIVLTRSLSELAKMEPDQKIVRLKGEMKLTKEQSKRMIQRIKERETKQYVV